VRHLPVPLVRADPGIGAGQQGHARPVQPGDVRQVLLDRGADRRHPRLHVRRGIDPRPEADGRADVDAPGGERGTESGRQDGALGGQAAAVLDAVDPRGDALLDRGQAVRVRGQREPEPVRLVDQGPQLLEAELAGGEVGAGGHDATAGHDLHHAGAPLGPLAHRAAQRLDTGRPATHRPAVPAG
jgi:hypothetical protein